jgi:molybdopterin converting factor small subunit
VIVTVRLFATFRDFLPQRALRSGLRMDVPEAETVQGLLKALQVPDDVPRLLLINGRYVSEGSLLADGDVVSVFPPLIGGCSSIER